MTATIIIPVKPFDEGKARLASTLTPDQREKLSRDFFRHVLGQATDAALKTDVLVVSRCERALGMAQQAGAGSLIEQGRDQNEALVQAMRQVEGPVLLLSSDLPFLTSEDIRAMLGLAKKADVGIATDQRKTGTNALFLSRPCLIQPRFGPDSRALHAGEAEKAGLRWAVIDRPGLALDVDQPEDLHFLRDRS